MRVQWPAVAIRGGSVPRCYFFFGTSAGSTKPVAVDGSVDWKPAPNRFTIRFGDR